MTTAALRVQVRVPTWMIVDSQPMVVMPGSVIDLPGSVSVSATSHTTLGTTAPATGEAPGTLGSHGGATSVRNLRTQA